MGVLYSGIGERARGKEREQGAGSREKRQSKKNAKKETNFS
jgi:hypothetical protein